MNYRLQSARWPELFMKTDRGLNTNIHTLEMNEDVLNFIENTYGNAIA